MKTVAGVLSDKGSEVFSIRPDATVLEALQVLADKNIGAVVVVEEDGRLSGILSERDYARKVILLDRSSAETLVSEIMTADVKTVSPSATVRACMEEMTRYRIRHLPVVEDGELKGVVSIGDVVEAMINELQALVDQLDGYIRSSP
jgi:CBS domain-containing protein